MPFPKFRLTPRVRSGLAGLLALFLRVGVGIQSFSAARATNRLITERLHLWTRITRLNQLLDGLREQENAVQGFLLSGDEGALARYGPSGQIAGRALAELAREDARALGPAFEEAKSWAAIQQATLNQALSRAQEGRREEASALLRSKEALRPMARLRTLQAALLGTTLDGFLVIDGRLRREAGLTLAWVMGAHFLGSVYLAWAWRNRRALFLAMAEIDCMALDITDRLAAEDALARVAEERRGLLEATSVAKAVPFSEQADGCLRFGPTAKPVLGLEEVRHLLSWTLPPGIHLQVQAEPSLPIIALDPSQLHQVVMNLTLNARDALGGQGVITLRTGRTEVGEAEAAALGKQPGPYLYFEVEDTGCGMTPEVVARIFTPLFTTKPVGKGTGLGLSVAYGIMDSHGGLLRCRSELGKGTRFTALLPQT